MGKTLKALTMLGCGWAALKCSENDDHAGAAIFGAIALGAGCSLAQDIDEDEREEDGLDEEEDDDDDKKDDEREESEQCTRCGRPATQSNGLCWNCDDESNGPDD